MSKFETKIPFNEMTEMKYDWNGFLFKSTMEYCLENKIFPEVVNIGELRNYISEYLYKNTGTGIGKSTFYRWQEDNEKNNKKEDNKKEENKKENNKKGPGNSHVISLLDRLVPNLRFLYRPFDVKEKEVLHDVYIKAWEFQYEIPLAIEGDEILREYIDYIKKEYFHEELYQKIKQLKGEAYDNAIKNGYSDLYACRLLDVFYEEYHQILIQNNITQFHAVIDKESLVLIEEQEGKFYFIDWDDFKEEHKEVLKQRQECLEAFADDLRTILLGTDINKKKDNDNE